MAYAKDNGKQHAKVGVARDEEVALLKVNGDQTCPANHKNFSDELISAFCYVVTSTMMVLSNKAVLSSFEFRGPNTLLLLQCLVAVILVLAMNTCGFCRIEKFRSDVIVVWLPVNIIFVGMIWTGTYALQELGVAMVTVLKNITNVIVLLGDWYLFGNKYNAGVWFCLALTICSALLGAFTDLDFNARGYSWQMANCVVTASYSLYLKRALSTLSAVTANPKGLDEWTMVYYNNVLSLPFIFILVLASGEASTVWFQPSIQKQDALFGSLVVVSCFNAFFMSASSLWFLSASTAGIYSLVGSLNKIPIAVLGYIVFDIQATAWNVASVLTGLVAGTLLVLAR